MQDSSALVTHDPFLKNHKSTENVHVKNFFVLALFQSTTATRNPLFSQDTPQCVVPQNESSLLHRYNTAVSVENWTLIYYCLLIPGLIQVSSMASSIQSKMIAKELGEEPRVAFSLPQSAAVSCSFPGPLENLTLLNVFFFFFTMDFRMSLNLDFPTCPRDCVQVT